jgi:predicted RNase H-like nuclease (RuvC/YqgF family)
MTTAMPEIEGWNEYRIHLIRTLDRLDGNIVALEAKMDMFRQDARNDLARLQREEIESIKKSINQLNVDFGMQKVRVGLLASGAGAAVSAIISYVLGHMK